ncbi:MAG: 50S ribosomal protein L9 [Candidatus Methylacidiphilales bacterium]
MPVEVILKKPIVGLGAESDIVKVKPGYARNFLLPRDLAVPATQASKKQVEALKRLRAEREAAELNAAQELAGRLSKVTLTFQMQTADEGATKVFGSVTTTDIIERLAATGIVLDKKHLDLGRPLKELGEHSVQVHLPQGVQAKFTVVLANPQAAAAEAEEVPAKKKKGQTRSTKSKAE